jgi:hypothetical protein
VITLQEILSEVTRVDLLDIDIQGAEHEVLACAIEEVNSKVAKIFVATHSREIDEKLKGLLGAQGWRCVTAYPCGETSETAWGPVRFVDGVQFWTNPRVQLA